MFRIMIDPGHGGQDPGAVANGLQEKHLTLDIAKRIKRILETEYADVTVYMTRESDVFVSLNDRAAKANKLSVDFFLSVHINAGGGTGFETYRYTAASAKSKSAQEAIHRAVMDTLGGGVTDRGMKTKNLAVLRETKMPAVLTETLFIDNAKDAALLKQSDFLEKVARGQAEGVARAFGLKRKQGAVQSAQPMQKKRLLTGTFNPEDAEKAAETLRKQFGWVVYVVDA